MKIFIPKMYKKSIFEIDYSKLKKLGYKLLIFDLDNTIGTISEKVCSKKSQEFLNSLTKDFQVIIASNSFKKRVSNFLKDTNLDYFSFSLKPTLKVLKKITKKYQIEYSKMVIIGDQVLTDIFLGNRKGLMTILVDPLYIKDFKITKINRNIEKLIMKKNKLIRGNYYEKE